MRKPRSLDLVLFLRSRVEDAAERDLATACEHVRQALAAEEALAADLARTTAENPGEIGSLLDTFSLHVREHRLAHLRGALQQAHGLLEQAEAARVRQQTVYLEARRGREVVDTLLKQRLQQQRVEAQRREIKAADDLFLGRFGRSVDDDATSVAR